jgi:hypothetical protein
MEVGIFDQDCKATTVPAAAGQCLCSVPAASRAGRQSGSLASSETDREGTPSLGRPDFDQRLIPAPHRCPSILEDEKRRGKKSLPAHASSGPDDPKTMCFPISDAPEYSLRDQQASTSTSSRIQGPHPTPTPTGRADVDAEARPGDHGDLGNPGRCT